MKTKKRKNYNKKSYNKKTFRKKSYNKKKFNNKKFNKKKFKKSYRKTYRKKTFRKKKFRNLKNARGPYANAEHERQMAINHSAFLENMARQNSSDRTLQQELNRARRHEREVSNAQYLIDRAREPALVRHRNHVNDARISNNMRRVVNSLIPIEAERLENQYWEFWEPIHAARARAAQEAEQARAAQEAEQARAATRAARAAVAQEAERLTEEERERLRQEREEVERIRTVVRGWMGRYPPQHEPYDSMQREADEERQQRSRMPREAEEEALLRSRRAQAERLKRSRRRAYCGPPHQCGICLETLKENEPKIAFSCGHCIHKTCWDDSRRNQHTITTCPICREPLSR